MKLDIALLGFIAVISSAAAATFQMTDVDIIEGKSGERSCWYPDLKVAIPHGKAYYSDDCLRYTCNVDMKTIYGVSCGTIAGPEGCKIVQDEGVYPKCCPRLDCTEMMLKLNAAKKDHVVDADLAAVDLLSENGERPSNTSTSSEDSSNSAAAPGDEDFNNNQLAVDALANDS